MTCLDGFHRDGIQQTIGMKMFAHPPRSSRANLLADSQNFPNNAKGWSRSAAALWADKRLCAFIDKLWPTHLEFNVRTLARATKVPCVVSSQGRNALSSSLQELRHWWHRSLASAFRAELAG